MWSPRAPDPGEAAAPVRAGDVLEGKWRIEEKIGEGGMGPVYLAHDISLERKVAIKILAPDLCNDAEFAARFEREAKNTAFLEHPNVVLVYAVGRHFGRPFIVMKLLEGESLAHHLRQHPHGLAPQATRSIFLQLCAGLEFIHSKGFIHRDVKSGNIFIDPGGKATLLDFGILRDTRSNQALTRVGAVMGTPRYIAPEQASGRPIDHRADIYALGVLLYECLTGSPPFQADTARRLIELHLRKPPPNPCERLPDLPPAAGEVVRIALAKRPDERFPSAAAMAKAIEEAFATVSPKSELELHRADVQPPQPLARKPIPLARRPIARAPAPRPENSAQPPEAAQAPKCSFAFPVVVVLALVTVAAVSWSLIKREQAEQAERPPMVALPLSCAALQPNGQGPVKTAKRDEQTPDTKAKALLAEGLDLARDRHFAFALGKYLQAEELDPKNVALLVATGEAYSGTGENDAASRYFAKALALEPGSDAARLGIVRVFSKMNKPREALRELRALVAAGFKDMAFLEADDDFANLRKNSGYREIKRLSQGGGAAGRPGTEKGEAAAFHPDTDVALVGMTGELRVVSSTGDSVPAPASVTIDGTPHGETPLVLQLNAGKHTVIVERQGYKRVAREVQVPLAGTVVVNLPLVTE